jgi:hypothetical protein
MTRRPEYAAAEFILGDYYLSNVFDNFDLLREIMSFL